MLNALPWWLAALLLVLNAFGEPVRQALRYQRDLLAQGEYWRLLTGHLVHGSWQHVALNVAGLTLVAVLFRGAYRAGQWLFIGVVSALCIDAGLFWLVPTLQWYVGLSGVLHGLLAAGAWSWWHAPVREGDRGMAVLLSLILIGKLGWEQWQGALPLSGDLNVIVDAHLYGAVGGLLAAWLVAWVTALRSGRLRKVDPQ